MAQEEERQPEERDPPGEVGRDAEGGHGQSDQEDDLRPVSLLGALEANQQDRSRGGESGGEDPERSAGEHPCLGELDGEVTGPGCEAAQVAALVGQ